MDGHELGAVREGGLDLHVADHLGHPRHALPARENVRVSQDRYREGLIPASELLDAQQRLLQAGFSHTRSYTQLRQARANLDRAVGR